MTTTFSDHNAMFSCLSSLCSLDPEELLNDILQEKQETQMICHNCDECAEATSRCKDCNEMLCDSCVRAHIRVKLTKDHCITRLNENKLSPTFNKPSSTCSSGSPNSTILNDNILCDTHLTETVKLYCDTCCTSICGECTLREHRGHNFAYLQDALESARRSSVCLIADAKIGAQSLREKIELSQRTIESLNLRSHTIEFDVRAFMRKLKATLEERECELLSRLEKIRVTKIKTCQQQIECLRSILNTVTLTSEILCDTIETGSALEILQAKENSFQEIQRMKGLRYTMPPVDDDILFIPPDTTLLLAIKNLGEISPPGNIQLSTIGDGLLRNVTHLPFNQNKPIVIEPPHLPDSLQPFLTNDNLIQEEEPKLDFWATSFRPTIENCMPHPITRNNRAISLSQPNGRDYIETSKPQLVFGGEGDRDGKLCRPWGVCCDLEGHIIVADRSNNRIQIFKSDGSFLRKFGSHGSEPGCFDRPAGVATDPMGRIVVTDKDNHRVQIFTFEGQFVYTFGEKGSKLGQFNYPWDVAVDEKGRIVVSDTRNHRIQLFAMDGTFLNKYGFENTSSMVKHFDSPRGVCFGSKGCVIVTDFNNHRLVVIDPNFRNARFLGSEGSSMKQFLRPQGVAVDSAGNIIVADSRNNRIQIFEQNGGFLWQFGSSGKEPGQMDRPSGVCLTADGKIVVVDFGNNRIQVF